MWTSILTGLGSVLTFIGQTLGIVSKVQDEKNTAAEVAAEEAAAQAAADAEQQRKDDEAAQSGDITNL